MKFCATCRDLSERSADEAEKLLNATGDLAAMAGKGDQQAFDAARIEVQGIRAQCQTLRADVARHRSEAHEH
jgi:hypothetical protein